MSEFKPGCKVVHVQYGEGTFIDKDEGWPQVDFGKCILNVRPSELTPADPVPDAAVMLVRELIAQEYEARGNSDIGASCRAGRYDNVEEETAFAKYIRANSLTVERLDRAMNSIGIHGFAERLHAALTEPRA